MLDKNIKEIKELTKLTGFLVKLEQLALKFMIFGMLFLTVVVGLMWA
jgi:hypothetical protein